ncbi:MAG: FkbM family methyltransferase [Candidatus Dormibacteraeota bacterium]|jgi:FkbM family methyltransferase|nr:FkbM family methyltransferase [Candidatus Dormibacteraeota bacterium]
MTSLRDAGSAWPVFEVLVGDAYHIDGLTRLLPLPVSVVDVGAHVGSATLRFARAWPEAAFVCAEPSPTSRRYLARNLSRNHVRATIVPAAVVSSADTAVFLREPTPGSCESQVAVQPLPHGPNEQLQRVSAVTMEELLAGTEGSVVVKLDCEGSEYDIVERTPASAWTSVLAVVMEYHPVPQRSFEVLASQLEKAGFRLARREPDHRFPNFGLAWFLQSHLGQAFKA